jgi:hypothetical protein
VIKNNLIRYKSFIRENAGTSRTGFDMIGEWETTNQSNFSSEDDLEYLKRILDKEWYEEEGKNPMPGDRIIYSKEGSEHNGKTGTFKEIREDGKYRLEFDDGKKLAADAKNVKKVEVKLRKPDNADDEPFIRKFNIGDRIIYTNMESQHNGEHGTFLSVRGDGKYRIEFDSGVKLAASPQFVRPE